MKTMTGKKSETQEGLWEGREEWKPGILSTPALPTPKKE